MLNPPLNNRDSNFLIVADLNLYPAIALAGTKCLRNAVSLELKDELIRRDFDGQRSLWPHVRPRHYRKHCLRNALREISHQIRLKIVSLDSKGPLIVTKFHTHV